MADHRSVMKEFRFLDDKRRKAALSPEEEARYARLKELAGPELGAGGLGFDVGAAAERLRESLLPAGLRNRPPPTPELAPEPEPEPLDLGPVGAAYGAFEPFAAPAPAPAAEPPTEAASPGEAPTDWFDPASLDVDAAFASAAPGAAEGDPAFAPPDAALDPGAAASAFAYDPAQPFDPASLAFDAAPADAAASLDPNADPAAAQQYAGFDPSVDPAAQPYAGFDPNVDPATQPYAGFDPNVDPATQPYAGFDPNVDPAAQPGAFEAAFETAAVDATGAFDLAGLASEGTAAFDLTGAAPDAAATLDLSGASAATGATPEGGLSWEPVFDAAVEDARTAATDAWLPADPAADPGALTGIGDALDAAADPGAAPEDQS
ncbi:MAG TPA: hypothetical protein VM753_20470, partial [Anaeromyxobacter sp.]|nr:hypothetical protein [Anaeromyxobacter sp.]